MKINVKCPPCIICGGMARVEVEESDFYAWKGSYDKPPVLAQDAFPYLSVDDRELLISGTHPECWEPFVEEVEFHANNDGLAGAH